MRINKIAQTNRAYWGGLTLAAVLYCMTMLLVVERLANSIQADAEREQRTIVEDQAESIKARLELFIFSDIYTANSIATLLSVDPEFVLLRFDELARNAVSRGLFIRNIGLAPNNIIQRIYPLERNEKALGLNFADYPEQLRTVNLAREQQSVFLAGPLELVQGGLGIIARFPVFSDFPNNQEYWGTVSVVIDVDPLLKASELNEFAQTHQVSIRGVDGKGADGALF